MVVAAGLGEDFSPEEINISKLIFEGVIPPRTTKKKALGFAAKECEHCFWSSPGGGEGG